MVRASSTVSNAGVRARRPTRISPEPPIRQLVPIPALDGLRGVAIALVLVTHARLVPGGALGVDLFFVLSGFLITSLLVSEFARTGTIELVPFFRRRALRLLPALAVMLFVYLLVSAVLLLVGRLGSDGFLTATTAAAAGSAYATNVLSELGVTGASPLSHLWSLSQEEQFYLVWPPILFLLLRGRASPRTTVLGLAILAGYVTLWRTILAAEGGSYAHIWYGADTRADSLVLGCAAGVLFSYGLVRSIPAWLPLGALVLGCFCVWEIELSKAPLDAGVFLPLFVVASAVLVLSSAHDPNGLLPRILDRGALRGLGRISYGLYLWHLPIFAVVGWVAGVPIAVVVAALSYRFVERPFLARKHRRRDVGRTPALPPVSAEPAAASA